MIKIPVSNAVEQQHNLKKGNIDIFIKIKYLNRTQMFLIDVKTKDFEILGTQIILGDYTPIKDITFRCICTYQSTAHPYAFEDFAINRTELYLL